MLLSLGLIAAGTGTVSADETRALANGVTITTKPGLELVGGLGAAPSRVELEGLQPGQRITGQSDEHEGAGKLSVVNRTPDRVRLTIRAVDVGAEPGTGSLVSLVEGARYGAASWLELATDSVDLQPRQIASIPVVIQVPDGASPGSMYAGIEIRQAPDGELQGTGAGIRSSLLVQYLFTVAGDLVYKGRIVDVQQPRFLERRRGRFATLGFTYRNEGNATNSLDGRIRFESLFGNSVADIPIEGRLVLRDSELSVREVWTDPPWIGRFTPVIELQGRGGEPVTEELEPIWVFPPLIYVILVIVALLIPGVWHWRNRRRWKHAMERLAYAESLAAANTQASETDDDGDEYDRYEYADANDD